MTFLVITASVIFVAVYVVCLALADEVLFLKSSREKGDNKRSAPKSAKTNHPGKREIEGNTDCSIREIKDKADCFREIEDEAGNNQIYEAPNNPDCNRICEIEVSNGRAYSRWSELLRAKKSRSEKRNGEVYGKNGSCYGKTRDFYGEKQSFTSENEVCGKTKFCKSGVYGENGGFYGKTDGVYRENCDLRKDNQRAKELPDEEVGTIQSQVDFLVKNGLPPLLARETVGLLHEKRPSATFSRDILLSRVMNEIYLLTKNSGEK